MQATVKEGPVIKQVNTQTTETREHMRGGTGTVTIRHYFTKDELNPRCRLCALLTLPPGASIGLHEHAAEDEIYIVNSGTGIITDTGADRPIGPGDAILTGNGASHAVRNNGSTELVITAVIIQY
jgi:mannose-6-phosphate isomerase-like protein (cupin superfamily)